MPGHSSNLAQRLGTRLLAESEPFEDTTAGTWDPRVLADQTDYATDDPIEVSWADIPGVSAPRPARRPPPVVRVPLVHEPPSMTPQHQALELRPLHQAIGRALALFAVVASVGCNGTAGPRSVFGSCTLDTDCQIGLECPRTGPHAGLCMTPCTGDATCHDELGADFYCFSDYCTFVCDYDFFGCTGSPTIHSCPSGTTCRDRGGVSCADFCVAR